MGDAEAEGDAREGRAAREEEEEYSLIHKFHSIVLLGKI